MKTLAILIPSIPERSNQLKVLINELMMQKESYARPEQIIIISLVDSKSFSIGEKRQQLINLAKLAGATYCTMIDDDDYITSNYVVEIVNAIHNENVDLITFNQMARINNAFSIIHFGHNYPIQDFHANGITHRPAWHCCVYKTDIASECAFDKINWGEDEAFSKQLNSLCQTWYHIPHVLHIYNHDQNKSAAL